MVGGAGVRLKPLTDACPKPLLEITGKPILERIIERLIQQGFKRICLAVHYKAEMIQQYCGDGRKWGIAIEYLHEREQMGTAGAVGTLAHQISKPTLVMNGDLVTEANFAEIVNHHIQCQAAATMSVVPYELKVPYGVVDVEGHFVTGVREKPVLHALVNAGIYVIGPDAAWMIPAGKPSDMPDLFNRLIAENRKTAAYVIKEQWTDVGDLKELERVRRQFSTSLGAFRESQFSHRV